MIQPTHLLGLPARVRLDQIEITSQTLTLSLAVETAEAPCPLCQHVSHRVHSHYTRMLADLPSGGKTLRLLVVVRRFFCTNEASSRKIFAERLSELTAVYARRTTRCTQSLAELGFALGGQAGARLGAQLGFQSSRMTLLRIIRRSPGSPEPTPRFLGIDEFAFRRGHTYGTLLIDLETNTPIDVLPDRQASTVRTWLQRHSGVQVISRDRASELALGARQGAPEALQIADRFHVLRNLGDVGVRVLSRYRNALKPIHLVTTPAAASPLLRHRRPGRQQRRERARAVLVARYDAVQRLVRAGQSQEKIAHQLHVNWKTVARYAHAETFPERPERPVSPGILVGYETYLRTRFLEGERNGTALFREVAARGYKGSRMTVTRFILGLRHMEDQGITITKKATTSPVTPRRAIGFMLRHKADLTEEETAALRLVLQIHPQVKRFHTLLQQFTQMLRERRGEELDAWLHAAFHSGIPELRQFAISIRQDQAAVQAGLILKWSNGVVEGHVNRVKVLKRSMYGRANFDLLRLRILHHRKCA